jgi:hypothetical protein
MTLDELITQTRGQARSSEPLELLASAAHRQQELVDLGEKLLDHFVQEARAAGYSWSQIGTPLGITKQAAQQRHSALHSVLGKIKATVESSLEGAFSRFSNRARRAVMLSQEEARRLSHHQIGAEHLLLGLLAESEGHGAQALQSAGITLDATRAEVEKIVSRGQGTPKRHIPFAPGAKKVLEQALREAFKLHHHHIGTEHILLGLLHEEGVGAQIIVTQGVQPDQLRNTVLTLLDQ